MKRKGLSLLLAVALLLALTSCDGETAKRKASKSAAEEEVELEDDAYDLFNEAIVNLMEEEAYDMSVKADVKSGESSTPVEMDYQLDGERYYGRESIGGFTTTETYYADGLKITSTEIPLLGSSTVTSEETDYDTFMEEAGDPSTMLATLNVSREAFDGAEIAEAEGKTTVTIVVGGITEMPEAIAGTANMLLNLDTATNITYDTATFTLVMTEDADLVSVQLVAGMDYNDADGNPVSVDLDLLATVNALGDEVTVKQFDGEIPEPGESEPTESEDSSFDISDYMDMIPEEYRDLIDQYM